MDRSEYQIEWKYADVGHDQSPKDPNLFAIHMAFGVRFPKIPPGPGHFANFAVNVYSPAAAEAEGISETPGRGILICNSFNYDRVVTHVEGSIHSAFQAGSREQALSALNTTFIRTNLDFFEHFIDSVLAADAIIDMIQEAFAGTERAKGITLHEAIALDNYATDEEQQKARLRDTELRWEDVADDDLASSPSYLTFLDPAGFRYYLPASMRWSLKNYQADRSDCSFFTCLSLLPHVAPRDVGKGLGQKFDTDEFIREHSFSPAQVKAIYHFLCFMAHVDVFDVREDDYPAMLKWRSAASR